MSRRAVDFGWCAALVCSSVFLCASGRDGSAQSSLEQRALRKYFDNNPTPLSCFSRPLLKSDRRTPHYWLGWRRLPFGRATLRRVRAPQTKPCALTRAMLMRI